MTSLKNDMRTDISHFFLNIRFELKKHLNRKRIVLVVALAIALPLLFYSIPPLLGTDYAETANAFASTNLGFISLLIVISGALFAGDAVSSEFEKKTGLTLFSTPQRRTSINIGKFVAALLATWLVISVYYLVTMLEIAQIFGVGAVSMEFSMSFLLALIYAASVVAVIFFFSTIMKRTITSTLIGFFLLMLILPIIAGVLQLADVEPWFLVTYSSDLMTNVLGTSSGGFGQNGPGGHFTGGFSPDFYVGVGVMIAYAVSLFLISIGLANRREME
ncbi:MAG: ABC transporter permease [Thermoplasmata archaeon]|nr:ABC transporter permease [Thermoplasmata archaeon]